MVPMGSSGASNDNTGNFNALKPYFGEVDPQYQKMLAEDKFAHETYNLPKAYEGKNKYLERVIDYLITNENDWYTSAVLPWVETDDLSVQWEIFRFNKTLMDLEPHQGVPRYVTAEREARTDRLVRRGLAFIIEHGFYTTDQGRQHYLMNLRQIVDSVNETAYHGVVYALLTADNHYKEWNRQHGTRVHRPSDLLRHQRRLWGIVQKQERGLYLLDAELKDQMRYEGVTPNMWILPSKMSIYCTMVPSAEVEYYRKGAGASSNLENGPSNMLTFRGSKVYESRPFDIDFIGEPYDLLVRRRQIGSHFVMQPVRDAAADTDEAKAEAIGAAGTNVFDMNEDNFQEITWGEAAVAAQASLAELANRGDNGAAEALLLVNVARAASDLAAAANLENLNLSAPHDGAVSPGMAIILFRPFQTYDMASGILLKGGLETGMTAHGHHDFMLSDDVIHKVHIGHYTFYHKSIVKTPKNICIAEDIFARNYVRGEGTQIYSSPTEFRDDSRDLYFKKDMIALPVPVGKNIVMADGDGTLERSLRALGGFTNFRQTDAGLMFDAVISNPLDLSGSFAPQVLDAVPTDIDDKRDDLYPGCNVYSRIFNFASIQTYGEDNQKFLNPLRHNNTTTFLGMQLNYSDDTGKMDKIQLNTGHWGPNVYAGCKAVRCGENAFLKDMEYEKLRTRTGLLK